MWKKRTENRLSIELNKAIENLNILEKISDTPDLIFTDLFDSNDKNINIHTSNFFCQVNIEGKYFYKYIVECLEKLPIFADSTLKCSSGKLVVYVSQLKDNDKNNEDMTRYAGFFALDKIMEIDFARKEYTKCDEAVLNYTTVINKKYELETCELSEFIKRYEDYTLLKRLRTAFLSFTSSKKKSVCLVDFVFNLTVSTKKLEKVVNAEKRKLTQRNEYYKEDYERKKALQKFYVEKAPSHINMIHTKQDEIANYLNNKGYSDINMKAE